MRLAWFSPVPPVPSGIAVCTADLVQGLADEYKIDLYVDEPVVAAASSALGRVRSAHDFVWRHRRAPYDLTIYQLGNSSHHDYSWPYLFRYPGLAVLHDAHLHHARAAALLRTKRADDYRAEFERCHPDARPDLAELAVAGFDNHMYYLWPMTALVVEASRLTVTHAPLIASELAAQAPSARIDVVRLAHGAPRSDEDRRAARLRVCRRHDLPPHALLVGVFGGLTPDKRLPQILDAFAGLLPYAPGARLVLAGAPARHYDVAADVRSRGLDPHVLLTGYLATDDELTDCVAACDISINMRWPTAREISGPWLRALAAGSPTIVVDLAHTIDVPSLDPRTWRPSHAGSGDPVTVAVDILDEDHSLRLALRRLAADEPLRRRLGQAARAYWEREHSPARMLDDYRRAIARATATPVPEAALPPHLVTDGDRRLDAIRGEMMLPREPWGRL